MVKARQNMLIKTRKEIEDVKISEVLEKMYSNTDAIQVLINKTPEIINTLREQTLIHFR